MSTTTEQNKAVIRRFFDAWNSRQPDTFDDLIAPNVVRHCEATPGIEARSLHQVKEFLRQDTAVFSPFAPKHKHFRPEGGSLAFRDPLERAPHRTNAPFLTFVRPAEHSI